MTKPQSQPSSSAGLITATIDAATGKIVEVRSVDDAGASSELTKGRRAKLSKQSGGATLQDLFAEAFEAGIACVLGDAELEEAGEESDEDAELRHQILLSMIENSGVRRLMQQEVLGRAIVATLIQNGAAGRGAAKGPSRASSAS